jgi:hypothetical protein
MRGENFVAHLDGLGGTPVAYHWCKATKFAGEANVKFTFRVVIVQLGEMSTSTKEPFSCCSLPGKHYTYSAG